MDGEIISSSEMREALQHATTIEGVITHDPILTSQLAPIRDFLHRLAFKGMH